MVIAILSLILVAVIVTLAIGELRWRRTCRMLEQRLLPPNNCQSTNYDPAELADLPAPVQRYFSKVLTPNQALIACAEVHQKGRINLVEEGSQWRPFKAKQIAQCQLPGFDWQARVSLFPGVIAYVHDAYLQGEGLLSVSLLGLLKLVQQNDRTDMAEAELYRYLAEAPWYPTVLLPQKSQHGSKQGVVWQPIDDTRAMATLADHSVSVSMIFEFNEQDLISTVMATARGRSVGDKVIPTAWQGRHSNYQRVQGMLVPMQSEVAWLLASGRQSYWLGNIQSIEYQFSSYD